MLSPVIQVLGRQVGRQVVGTGMSIGKGIAITYVTRRVVKKLEEKDVLRDARRSSS